MTLNGQDYAAALPAASFSFYPEPTLLTRDPVGGPVAGGTTVSISGHLPGFCLLRSMHSPEMAAASYGR